MRRPGSATTSRKCAPAGRSARRNRLLALAILAILALAALAPAGQASGSEQQQAERAQQHAIHAAERAAERETLRMQKRAAREEAARQKLAERRAAKHAGEQGKTTLAEHAVVTIECKQIVIEYNQFAAVPGSENTVQQKILFRQADTGPTPTYAFPTSNFSFPGSSATTVIPIAAPLGDSTDVLRVRFNTNGVHGSFRARAHLYCGPIPQYTLTTEQSLGEEFATLPLEGAVGQTVDYRSVAMNTGNTPMTFTNFSDPGCDGTIAGGGKRVVGPRDSMTFVCTHTLTEGDRLAGAFANAASVTGSPETSQGGPVTEVSGGVLVTPIKLGDPTSKTNPGGGSPEVSTGAAPAAAGPGSKTSVLGFSSTAVPSLLGPARCVRGAFTVSVKSAGVANVTFYIDGRRLARRTVHSAVKGLISLHINGARLKPGTHRLTASITMAPGSPTAKALIASRARVVRRCQLVKQP